MGSRQRRERRAKTNTLPVRLAVTCRDATHHIVLTRKGRFCVPDHDMRAESVIEAMGADSATCISFFKAWKDACRRELLNQSHPIMDPTRLRYHIFSAADRHDLRHKNPPFQYPELRERILLQAAHTAQSVFELANYGDGCSCSTAIYVVGCNVTSPGCPRDKVSCLLAHVCPVFNQRYRSHRARENKISGNVMDYKKSKYKPEVTIAIEPVSFLLCVHKTGGIATWNETKCMLLSLLRPLSLKGRAKHRLKENEHVALAGYHGRSGLRATKCIITPSDNGAWIIRKWLERLR